MIGHVAIVHVLDALDGRSSGKADHRRRHASVWVGSEDAEGWFGLGWLARRLEARRKKLAILQVINDLGALSPHMLDDIGLADGLAVARAQALDALTAPIAPPKPVDPAAPAASSDGPNPYQGIVHVIDEVPLPPIPAAVIAATRGTPPQPSAQA